MVKLGFSQIMSGIKTLALIAPGLKHILEPKPAGSKLHGVVMEYTGYQMWAPVGMNTGTLFMGVIPRGWIPYLAVEVTDKILGAVKSFLN